MSKYKVKDYDWGIVAFEVVCGLVALVIFGAYYFIPHTKNTETSAIKPISAETLIASSSVLSESELDGKNEISKSTSTSTVTAYIKNIDGNKITLDYFDLLGGDEAKKAVVQDKKCTQKQIDEDDGCFPNGVVYFRNQNPKLRILTLSPETKIYKSSAFDKSADGTAEILLQELRREYTSKVYSDLEKFINLPYKITLNDKGEVIKIEEIFRP
jgi:hypothetical protein